jgi:peptidylprolyl isomerase
MRIICALVVATMFGGAPSKAEPPSTREPKVAPPNTASKTVSSTGTGFFVSENGHIVTNAHVVDGCQVVRSSRGGLLRKIAKDDESDLALYIASEKPDGIARLRGGRGARAGESVVAVGFPLQGLLSSDPIVTTGIISALSGLRNDRRKIQITAPVQPGNSGGPLLGENGSIVGVVVGKLNAMKVAEVIGDIPQNVNFAVSLGTLQSFLNANDVTYALDDSDATKRPVDIAAEASRYTVLISCLTTRADQVAIAPERVVPTPNRPAPQTSRQGVSTDLPPGDDQNTLVIDTTKGRIIIMLRNDIAPKHVQRLKQLAREKFYDNVAFHRVISGFMAQTGDGHNGNGTGGSKYPDLKAEFSQVPFRRGIVGMARKGGNIDSANSQFFIMSADAPFLNGQYTVIGEVLSGMDAVDKLKAGEPVPALDRVISVRVGANAK